MKRIIILSVLITAAVTIVVLQKQYTDNHILNFLYGTVKGLSIIGFLSLIVKKIINKPVLK